MDIKHKDYSNVPEQVSNFLGGLEIIDNIDEVLFENSLPNDTDEKILDLVEQIVLGSLSLTKLPTQLKVVYKVDNETLQNLSTDIAGMLLLPIAGVIGDVASQIRAWGGDPADYDDQQVVFPLLTPEKFAQMIVADYVFTDQEKNTLGKRLEHLVAQYLSGEQDKQRAIETLQKPQKIGGMEMDEENATNYIDIVDDKRQMYALTTDTVEEKSIEQEEETNEFISAKEPQKVIPQVALGNHQENKDFLQKQIKQAQGVKVDSVVVPPKVIEKSKAIVTKANPVAFDLEEKGEPKVQPKNKIDTFNSDDEADIKKMAEFIISIDISKSSIKKPDPKQIAVQIDSSLNLGLQAKGLIDRFIQIIDSRILNVRDAFQTRQQIEQPVGNGGLAISGKQLADVMTFVEAGYDSIRKQLQEMKKGEKEKYLQMKKGEKQKVEEEKRKQQEQLNKRYEQLTGKFQVAPEKIQKAVMDVSVSDKTLRQSNGSKPKVDDIRFKAHLVGPIQEIGEMSIVEFRRVASDPNVAVEKIGDKLELIASQGFNQKLEAVKAWRNSPLYRMFNDLSQKALFSATDINAILSKEKNGLSPEEYRAVAKLNTILHV
ncbi:MAG: hypothetical protein ABIH21_04655 [Patescibacteria group bacterium]